ncbi:hypothetical protein [Paraburkholderia sp.]|uniref:hypothetical protein n=1 Tax=Paraburkholderia sp. TaxID=1926495 RepID=UPI002383AD6E|nr:hypothetical protein [Paraburkholderia sp.]MDE1179442.1 hypothetical protein [Paraburkholderia sp.]
MTPTPNTSSAMTDERIKDIAKSVYGTCATEQDMDFARALLAAQPSQAQAACKPGGCAAIGCDGGHYCFNADGTPKVQAQAEAVAWMYKCVKPGTSGVRLIEKRAEAPKGGWVDYVEIPLYASPPTSPVAQEQAAEAVGWAPPRIWLQRGMGDDGSHTWCQDSIGDCEQAEYALVVTSDSRTACPTCHGNDADLPCAFPEGGNRGCPRDIRLGRTASPVASNEREGLTFEEWARQIAEKLSNDGYSRQADAIRQIIKAARTGGSND